MSQVEVQEHLISNQIITAVIVYGPKRTDIKDLRKGGVTEHSIKSAKYHANANPGRYDRGEVYQPSNGIHRFKEKRVRYYILGLAAFLTITMFVCIVLALFNPLFLLISVPCAYASYRLVCSVPQIDRDKMPHR